jgi:hypothetical protein
MNMLQWRFWIGLVLFSIGSRFFGFDESIVSNIIALVFLILAIYFFSEVLDKIEEK